MAPTPGPPTSCAMRRPGLHARRHQRPHLHAGPGYESDSFLLMQTVANPASSFHWPTKAANLRTRLTSSFGATVANAIEMLADGVQLRLLQPRQTDHQPGQRPVHRRLHRQPAQKRLRRRMDVGPAQRLGYQQQQLLKPLWLAPGRRLRPARKRQRRRVSPLHRLLRPIPHLLRRATGVEDRAPRRHRHQCHQQ